MINFSKLLRSSYVFSLGLCCGIAYLTGCGQTNNSVSGSSPIDGNNITAVTLVTSGTITSGGNITAPSIKLTTGAEDGKFLMSNSSGEASWASPFRTSCPEGYSLIGTSGTPDAFCITTSYEKPGGFAGRNWSNAYNNCAAKTPAASLCTINEWRRACKSSVALQDKDQGLWLLDISPYWNQDSNSLAHDGAWIIDGDSCEPQEVLPKSAVSVYRCCFR